MLILCLLIFQVRVWCSLTWWTERVCSSCGSMLVKVLQPVTCCKASVWYASRSWVPAVARLCSRRPCATTSSTGSAYTATLNTAEGSLKNLAANPKAPLVPQQRKKFLKYAYAHTLTCTHARKCFGNHILSFPGLYTVPKSVQGSFGHFWNSSSTFCSTRSVKMLNYWCMHNIIISGYIFIVFLACEGVTHHY